MVHTHRAFLESVVQRLLSRTRYKNINAFVRLSCLIILLTILTPPQREFTLHLLPPVTRKLRHSAPLLIHHPSLLAHTIYQALAFDASLKDEGFSLENTTAEGEEAWNGVSDEILGKKEWFDTWLEGERKCETFFFGIF